MNVWDLLFNMLGWGLVVLFALLGLVVVIAILGAIIRLIRRETGHTKRTSPRQVRDPKAPNADRI